MEHSIKIQMEYVLKEEVFKEIEEHFNSNYFIRSRKTDFME